MFVAGNVNRPNLLLPFFSKVPPPLIPDCIAFWKMTHLSPPFRETSFEFRINPKHLDKAFVPQS